MARGAKLIAENRKARHDYHFLERLEAGVVLTGSEVKSLREGRVSLQHAYADVREGEARLVGAHRGSKPPRWALVPRLMSSVIGCRLP
jgi:SsrA-binding protein